MKFIKTPGAVHFTIRVVVERASKDSVLGSVVGKYAVWKLIDVCPMCVASERYWPESPVDGVTGVGGFLGFQCITMLYSYQLLANYQTVFRKT